MGTTWDMIAKDGFDGLLRACQAIAKSGMMPKGVGSPEAAAAIIMRGHELGMGPMEALASIHSVQGKFTLDASAQLAIAMRRGVRVEWLENNEKIAKCRITHNGIVYVSTYTIEMARAANLTKNPVWSTHPAAMLRARATTSGIRAACPDVMGGPVYDADELVTVETTPEAKVEPKPEPKVDDGAHPDDWREVVSKQIAALDSRITLDAIDGYLASIDRPLMVDSDDEQRAKVVRWLLGAGQSKVLAWLDKAKT